MAIWKDNTATRIPPAPAPEAKEPPRYDPPPPPKPPPPILANMVPAQTASLLSAVANRSLQPLGQEAQAAARDGTRSELDTLPPLGAPLIRLYPVSNISGSRGLSTSHWNWRNQSRASMNAFGSAIGTLPLPMALIALRFLDPNTAPKPHRAAWEPGP